jgi:ParB family chromosome partitioning protein
MSDVISHVDVGRLFVGRKLRLSVDQDRIHDVAESIKERGEIDVPIVCHDCGDGRYEIVSGEYRWRAAAVLELKTVPVIIRKLDPSEFYLVSMADKYGKPLSPIEEALLFKRLHDDSGLTHKQIADLTLHSANRVYVSKSLRLLKLPQEAVTFVHEGRLSPTHGQILLSLNIGEQVLMAKMAVEFDWDSRTLKSEVDRRLSEPSDPLPRKPLYSEHEISEQAERYKALLGIDLKIKARQKKLSVELSFDSMAELHTQLGRLIRASNEPAAGTNESRG